MTGRLGLEPMDPVQQFQQEMLRNIDALAKAGDLHRQSLEWLRNGLEYRYSYNFSWLGRPIIQYPQDMVAIQELIWQVKPDFIIETGIAHGGSVIMTASMLALLDYCVVFDTIIEQLPGAMFTDRPWGPGNSPMTAVQAFLSRLESGHVIAHDGERLKFAADGQIDSKLLISVAPGGYLRRA